MKTALVAAALAAGSIPSVRATGGDVATAKAKHSTSIEGQRIDVEMIVNASLEDVWHKWTTNEGIQSFFAERTNVKLGIDGPFEMFFLSDAPEGMRGSEGCKFLSYLPMEMLSFSWNAPPSFKHARGRHTWVVLRFQELDQKRVRIMLTHLGWDEKKAEFPDHAQEWDEVRDYFSKAWPRVLQRLQERFRDQ